MLPVIEHVFKLSELIIIEGKRNHNEHVYIDDSMIEKMTDLMAQYPLPEKQVDEHKIELEELTKYKKESIILNELVLDSINYCFWQYNSNIRPNDSGSTKMRELLTIHFNAAHALKNDINFKYQIRRFIKALQRNRFPMMDKRIHHLESLGAPYFVRNATNESCHVSEHNVATTFVKMVASETYSLEALFDFLITEIDGFGDDPFLKRACLFFLQLNRILGMFEGDVKMFPIPADYQVPKIMRYFNLFDYHPYLYDKVKGGVHLPENSPGEMAIRAATIITGKRLCALTGWSASDVDGWFFIRRKKCNDLFHLCQTSNY